MERGGGSPECSGCAAGEDAPFRSPALAQRVAQHHLWHGDLLADGASFAAFRAWLEERLPRVTQTGEGYFTAALVRGLQGGAPRFLVATRRGRCAPRCAPRRRCDARRGRGTRLCIAASPCSPPGRLRWALSASALLRSLPPSQAAVNSTTSEALAPDTCQYATCLWTRDVSNVRARPRARRRQRLTGRRFSPRRCLWRSFCRARRRRPRAPSRRWARCTAARTTRR